MRRFSPRDPCPVCGGHPKLAHGRGERCAGFFGDDERAAHCTREEYRGRLEPSNTTPPTYRHWFGQDDCHCGARHTAHGSVTEYRTPKPAPSPRRKTRTPSTKNITQRRQWPIRHFDGRLFGFHRRTDFDDESRDIRWWPKGVLVKKAPLYRSEHLRNVPASTLVIVTEGEPDTDALVDAGYHAVGTVCGADTQPPDEALAVLHGRRVALWPDNDPPGWKHMAGIAGRLHEAGCEPLLVDWPEAPSKGGACDYRKAHGKADLRALLEAARPYYGSPSPPSAGEEVDDPEPLSSVVCRISTDVEGKVLSPMAWAILHRILWLLEQGERPTTRDLERITGWRKATMINELKPLTAYRGSARAGREVCDANPCARHYLHIEWRRRDEPSQYVPNERLLRARAYA